MYMGAGLADAPVAVCMELLMDTKKKAQFDSMFDTSTLIGKDFTRGRKQERGSESEIKLREECVQVHIILAHILPLSPCLSLCAMLRGSDQSYSCGASLLLESAAHRQARLVSAAAQGQARERNRHSGGKELHAWRMPRGRQSTAHKQGQQQ